VTTPVGPAQAVASVAQREANDIAVARACKVVGIGGGGAWVSVQLLVGEWLDVGGGEQVPHEHPVIGPVPVHYLRSGRATLVIPPRVGDVGLLLVRDVSHDQADAGASQVGAAPASRRRHDLDDAIYLPGVGVTSDTVPASAIRADGGPVLDMDLGVEFRVGGGAASMPVAIHDPLLARIEAIEDALDGHTHGSGSYVDGDGVAVSGTSGAFTFSPDDRDFASSRLYTDDLP